MEEVLAAALVEKKKRKYLIKESGEREKNNGGKPQKGFNFARKVITRIEKTTFGLMLRIRGNVWIWVVEESDNAKLPVEKKAKVKHFFTEKDYSNKRSGGGSTRELEIRKGGVICCI